MWCVGVCLVVECDEIECGGFVDVLVLCEVIDLLFEWVVEVFEYVDVCWFEVVCGEFGCDGGWCVVVGV